MAKRRKGGGKQGSRATTPSNAAGISDSDRFLDSVPGGLVLHRTATTSNTIAVQRSQHASSSEQQQKQQQLVLTSDKRRGIYECDYCHSDISQVPRIRCATCPDFDLCLDCFATTDHSAAIARLRAAATAHGAIHGEGGKVAIANAGGAFATASSTIATVISATPGISPSAIHHDDSHKYRVADSTRYPMFPSARVISKELLVLQSNDDTSGADGDDDEIKTNDDNNDEDDDDDDDDDDVATMDTTGNRMSDTKQETTTTTTTTTSSEMTFVKQDDPKTFWTVEEDLRLLDAISTCGLGNWADIAEAVAGQGSSSKTAKRCMERYFDDFLGRYGHILPAYTIVENDDDDTSSPPIPTPGATATATSSSSQDVNDTDTVVSSTSAGAGNSGEALDNEPKKRRMERMSSFGVASLTGANRRGKKLKVIPTASLPGYEKVWPNPYLPPLSDIQPQVGQDVGRDHRYRAEQLYVKLIANASSKDEVDRIRKEWEETRLNKPNGPTALPMRPEDLSTLPGSELAGFMSRRGDFDLEWENDAENVLADMEFSASDSSQDRDLKVKVIQIYNSKLDERDRRKQFLLNRNLLDYRQRQQSEAKLPRDERDLVRRMRLFERLHTPEEHAQFIEDILKAKRLRKEIAQLQMYRRIGIRTLTEAEKYENDKKRREIHKMSHLQKEAEKAEKAEAMAKMISGGSGANKDGGLAATGTTGAVQGPDEDDLTSSLWKQYRTNDRRHRRSINRNSTNNKTTTTTTNNADTTEEKADGSLTTEKGKAESTIAMLASATTTPVINGMEESNKMAEEGNANVDHMQGMEQPVNTTTTTSTTTTGTTTTGNSDERTKSITNDAISHTKKSDANIQEQQSLSISEEKTVPKEDDKNSKNNNTDDNKEKQNQDDEDTNDDFPLAGMAGYDLLTKKEIELCRTLKMKPTLYLKVKQAILQESFRAGLCDKESSGTNKNGNCRTIVTVDIQKRGNVVDFMVKAGWISTKVGNAIK